MPIAAFILTAFVVFTGLTPLATAQTSSSDVLVIDGLSLPKDHRYEIYNPSSSSYSPIDVKSVPSYVQKKARVYDRTAKAWVVEENGSVNKTYQAASGGATPPPASTAQKSPTTSTAQKPAPAGTTDKPSGAWQRIHGKVESVQGTTLSFKADDGRQLSVDVSKVDAKIRQALTQGEGVTVIGHEWVDAKTLRANYVQQDSSDPSHGGKTAPSASPSTKP